MIGGGVQFGTPLVGAPAMMGPLGGHGLNPLMPGMGAGMMGGGMAPGYAGGMGPGYGGGMMGAPGYGMGPAMAGGMMGAGMVSGADMHVSVPLSAPPPQQGMTRTPSGRSGYVHTTSMNERCCQPSQFEGLYTASLPMDQEEFQKVFEDINYQMVAQQWRCCCCFCGEEAAISSVRQQLSECNERYKGRGIDFQLHTQQHMQVNTTHHNDHHHGQSNGLHNNFHHGTGRDVNVHMVNKYTIVIQVVAQAAPQQAAPAVAPQQVEMGAAAPAAAPQLLQFQCPDGSVPGDAVQVPLPDGTMKEVLLPPGVTGGQMFAVDVSPPVR